MEAQPTVSNAATSSGAGVSGATGASQGFGSLLNGVEPSVRVEQQGAELSGLPLENPNVYDPSPAMPMLPHAEGRTIPSEGQAAIPEPPYGLQPNRSANVLTTEAPVNNMMTPPRTMQRSSPSPTGSVQVQEFFTAESRTTSGVEEQGGVSWMTRVSELLRTTVSRGAHGVDRMLDSLGLHAQQQPPQAARRLQGPSHQLPGISPPEELAGSLRPMPVPDTWNVAVVQPQPPLFGPSQLAQMRQSQQEYPHLYGRPMSEVESERSSRLQAEVQRQLEEYAQRHQAQVTQLQREVEELRREREFFVGAGVREGGRDAGVREGPTVPQGNPLRQPQEDPRHLRVRETEHGEIPREVQGNAHAEVREDPTVPQGNPPRQPQEGPGPLQGSAFSDRVPNLPHGGPSAQQQASRGSLRDHLDYVFDPTVPRGNPAQPPEGPGYFYEGVRGQESGVFHEGVRGQESGVIHEGVRGQESGPNGEKQDGTRGKSPPTEPRHGNLNDPTETSAQQWLGGGGQTQDAMALIAGGVAQLQAAMLKQMTGERGGEKSPEAVKPGTTSLATLPPVRTESSSVDLLDWLELIEAPMSDLSDGSAVWWKQVRGAASEAYDVWVVSGPIEKLSVVPNITDELEGGRWSRVNSRAASMVLTALDESIRSELVSRRMTGSTTSIIFRLLTLYQPGGEEEKFRTLQQLQSPPQELEEPRAVEALWPGADGFAVARS